MSRAVEQAFRHTYGRLVATLVRRWGADRLEDIEDAVQSALVAALDHWRDAPPDDPSAWLYTVAHRRVMADARTATRRRELLAAVDPSRAPTPAPVPEASLPAEIDDDLLRMLFVGCDPALPATAQLVLTLKVLCGFSVREIAARLFLGTDAVRKRLQRARARLRQQPPDADQVATLRRLPAVHHVLYLLFTEGHLSVRSDTSIRAELCDEALRLGGVLARHPLGDTPETQALMALMHLHRARLSARTDAHGGLLLLAEQDRATWDRTHIARGMDWLARSARGDRFSRFHAEARIAAAHALAPSFQATPWRDIATTYELLETLAPSPLHTLNRALAVAEADGPEAGLHLLDGLSPPSWLAGSHLWAATIADLHRRAGHRDEGARLAQLAIDLAPTAAVAQALRRRWASGR